MLIGQICKPQELGGGNPGRVDSRVKKMETKVGITSDKVTPIHLCETLELVNKTLVSEYLDILQKLGLKEDLVRQQSEMGSKIGIRISM